MCESPTNNSLASWDSGVWSKERKKKSCSTLCQEFVSVFAKNWAHSSGLSLCRLVAASQTEVHTQMPANMASTSCLWFNTRLGFCPPKHNKEAQNGVSTSAILGLLANTIRSTFQEFFFLNLLYQDKDRAAVQSRVMEYRSCAKHCDKANMQIQMTHSLMTGTKKE